MMMCSVRKYCLAYIIRGNVVYIKKNTNPVVDTWIFSNLQTNGVDENTPILTVRECTGLTYQATFTNVGSSNIKYLSKRNRGLERNQPCLISPTVFAIF